MWLKDGYTVFAWFMDNVRDSFQIFPLHVVEMLCRRGSFEEQVAPEHDRAEDGCLPMLRDRKNTG
jgi:hypothetical protein